MSATNTRGIPHAARRGAGLALALLALALLAAPARAADYRYRTAFGKSGKAPGQMDHPLAVAVDAAGTIVLTDWGNKRVQLFRSDGAFIRAFDVKPRLASRSGAKGPTGLSLADNGDLFVVDQDADVVKRFDRSGKLLAQFGQKGSWLERFKEPRGIALDRLDNLYVADCGNYRVQKFTLAGEFLSEIKYKDVVSQQFVKPRGLACDREGTLYVVYPDIARVVSFDREGRVLREFGPKGKGDRELFEPRYVAVDNLGFIYVTDFALSKVLKLDRALAVVDVIGRDAGEGELLYPEGAALDASGNLIVADSGHNRVVVYEPPEKVKHLNWAYLYTFQGDFTAAAREYEAAYKIEPDAPGLKESLVDALVRSGGKAARADNRSEAVATFRRALAIDPLNAYAIRELKDLEAIPGTIRKASMRYLVIGGLVALAIFLSFLMSFGGEAPAEDEEEGPAA